jgi:hypothetical protein
MGNFWIVPLLRSACEMTDELGLSTSAESETLLSCLWDVSFSNLALARVCLERGV